MQELSVDGLRDELHRVTEGEPWGKSLAPTKGVFVRVNDQVYPVTMVSTSFHDGKFCVMLDAF